MPFTLLNLSDPPERPEGIGRSQGRTRWTTYRTLRKAEEAHAWLNLFAFLAFRVVVTISELVVLFWIARTILTHSL